jgi:hypothetical protein
MNSQDTSKRPESDAVTIIQETRKTSFPRKLAFSRAGEKNGLVHLHAKSL